MIANPGCFAWNHCHRVAVGRNDDVGVAVQNMKPGQITDGTLESGIFTAANHEGVEAG